MIKFQNGRVHLKSLGIINKIPYFILWMSRENTLVYSLNTLQALLKCFSFKKSLMIEHSKIIRIMLVFHTHRRKLFLVLKLKKDQMIKVVKGSYILVRKYLTSLWTSEL